MCKVKSFVYVSIITEANSKQEILSLNSCLGKFSVLQKN
jgi:hypothetical protein